MLGRSPLRSDCTVVLNPGSRRRTRCSLRSLAQTAAPSPDLEARCARDPRSALLVAQKIAPSGCRLPRCGGSFFRSARNGRRCKGAWGQAMQRAHSEGAEKRRARGRARSAIFVVCSSQLSERSERSEHSEFCDGPRDRASQGRRSAAETASVKRHGLSPRAFAARTSAQKRRRGPTATGRTQTIVPCERFMRRGWREARWSN